MATERPPPTPSHRPRAPIRRPRGRKAAPRPPPPPGPPGTPSRRGEAPCPPSRRAELLGRPREGTLPAPRGKTDARRSQRALPRPSGHLAPTTPAAPPPLWRPPHTLPRLPLPLPPARLPLPRPPALPPGQLQSFPPSPRAYFTAFRPAAPPFLSNARTAPRLGAASVGLLSPDVLLTTTTLQYIYYSNSAPVAPAPVAAAETPRS